jgi:hypothetical protein
MNCVIHQNVAAVARCGRCGVGICAQCAALSDYRVGNAPLCRECNYAVIRETLKRERRARVWTIVKLFFGIIFLWFGLSYLFGEFKAIELGIIFLALGGFPTAWRYTSPTARQRWKDDMSDAAAEAQMPFGGLLGGLIRFVVRVVISGAIAVVAAPVLVVVNIVKIFRQSKRINLNKRLLEKY